MATTAEQMRAWTGPAIFSFGFRPFFLGAAVWAAVAMLLWIPMLSGHLSLPTAFDPVSWHAHEFLFGYLAAVVAGFLLTAVPNWTGRLPIVGWPLAGLWSLWLAGRLVIAVSADLRPGVGACCGRSPPGRSRGRGRLPATPRSCALPPGFRWARRCCLRWLIPWLPPVGGVLCSGLLLPVFGPCCPLQVTASRLPHATV